MAKAFSSASKEIDYSKYCYNVVQDIINVGYSKEFREGKQISLGYPGWSPNNVRRLIISSDDILIQYHVINGMKNQTFVKGVTFDKEKAMYCRQSPNYSPMLKALVGDRVCSGIEEIIISNKNIHPKELELSEVGIKTSGDAYEGLKRRYKRLYAVTITNLTIRELQCTIPLMKNKEFLVTEHIKENKNLSGGIIQSIIFNKDTWLTNKPNLQPLGVDGKGYLEDREEGRVGNYFNTLIKTIKEEEKKETLRKFNEKRERKLEEPNVVSLKRVGHLVRLLETGVKGFRIFSELCRAERIKSGLVGYVPMLDRNANSIIAENAFTQGYSRTLRDEAITLANAKTVKESITKGKHSYSNALGSCIEEYFSASVITKDEDGALALERMMISMVEGIFKSVYDPLKWVSTEMPKYSKVVFKNVKDRTFYICDSYPSMVGLQEFFPKVKKLEGFNAELVVEDLSILFTVYCEIFLIHGSGYRRNTVKDWYLKLEV